MADAWERSLVCEDGFRRDRPLRIFVTEDDPRRPCVGLHTPPGDVAILDVATTRSLQQHIAAATLEAAHRGAQIAVPILGRYERVHHVTTVNGDRQLAGVMAIKGDITFSGIGWFQVDPDIADELADSFRAAAAAARQQRLRRT
jgi:hypothetical protein